MTRTILIAAVTAAALLGGCKSGGSAVATADNAQQSLDWAGTYKGTVPCGDCEGIATALTLTQDGTYILHEEYLGTGSKPFTEKGPFSWDAAGSVIALGDDTPPRSYKVGEGRIWHLDVEGKVITGDLADLYILTKE